ncbi:MAG TPA: BamA/TamA family outer membrane protein [Usitatibacter sp.]|nr:BamA/TamA family outer membrane protein [Usitatibacter sp.]
MRTLTAVSLALALAGGPALGEEPAPRASSPPPAEAVHEKPPAAALTVTWDVPQPLRGLYEKYLPPPKSDPNEDPLVARRAWVRGMRARVPQLAAAEGWFSPKVDIRFDESRPDHVTIAVDPGPRTVVGSVAIEFAGDLALAGPEREKRREELTRSWTLGTGAPFVSADWEAAKTAIQERLDARDYAAGVISKSEARVEAAANRADLRIVLDSGPRFTFGDVYIDGLQHYPEAVIRRLIDLERGEPYTRARLDELQHTIQTGPWFSSVVIDIDRDRAHPQQAPVRMTVVERPRREVGLAVGYGTDDGARAETSYRDRDLLDRGFDLQSSIRAAQEDQLGYADVYLPPGRFGQWHGKPVTFTDSFGVLAEHSTVQKNVRSRFAAAGYRHFELDATEYRVGLSYQIERQYPEGAEPRVTRALAPVVFATWRRVDNLYDPRRGAVVNLQFAAGAKDLASGEDFFKAYGETQFWIPLGKMDQLLLRGELGRTFAASRLPLPQDFLFVAGGSRSNRGYAYQSLGVQEGDAIVGGRYLATGSLEYVHWLNDKWGAALFTDVGDAKDSWKDLRANPSYGAGARFKTPAGPLGLDLAYAEKPRKFRLSFSVTVAF